MPVCFYGWMDSHTLSTTFMCVPFPICSLPGRATSGRLLCLGMSTGSKRWSRRVSWWTGQMSELEERIMEKDEQGRQLGIECCISLK